MIPHHRIPIGSELSSKRRLDRGDPVTKGSMRPEAPLLGKERPHRDQRVSARQRVEATLPAMPKEHVRAGPRTDIEMLPKSGERRGGEPRGTVACSANVKQLSAPVSNTPDVHPKPAPRQRSLEPDLVRFHLCPANAPRNLRADPARRLRFLQAT
jgi:hypothetical protein